VAYFPQRFYTRDELQSTRLPGRRRARAPPTPAANGGYLPSPAPQNPALRGNWDSRREVSPQGLLQRRAAAYPRAIPAFLHGHCLPAGTLQQLCYEQDFQAPKEGRARQCLGSSKGPWYPLLCTLAPAEQTPPAGPHRLRTARAGRTHHHGTDSIAGTSRQRELSPLPPPPSPRAPKQRSSQQSPYPGWDKIALGTEVLG